MKQSRPSEPESPTLKRPEKTVLSQEIYSILRKAILEGALESGTRIVEESLAKQMDVSRAPLREALWHLERDGLVVDGGLRERRVVSLTEDDIKELHLIRSLLETLAFQNAAKRISQEEMLLLDELIAGMNRAVSEGDTISLAQHDYEFHEYLCRASGLPRLFGIWKEQFVLFRLWLNVVAKAHRDDTEEIVASHKVILAAVKTKDVDTIARSVHDHIYRSGHALTNERAQWAEEQAWLFQSRS